jgi:hypothetical protein
MNGPSFRRPDLSLWFVAVVVVVLIVLPASRSAASPPGDLPGASPAQGATLSLSANPDVIPAGNCSVLRWEVVPPEYALYLNGESVAPQGEREVCPKISTPFSLVALTPEGAKVRTVQVRVAEDQAQLAPVLSGAPSVQFYAVPPAISSGDCADLRWSVAPGDLPVRLEGQPSPPAGTLSVCPSSTRSYRLNVDAPPSAGGPRDLTVTVQVSGSTAPLPPGMWDEAHPLIDFAADRTSLESGECTTLRWRVRGGYSVELERQRTTWSGQMDVCPSRDRTYELGVDVGEHFERRQVVVRVASAPPAAPAAPAPASPVSADIAPTDVFPDNLPRGQMWVGITNHGHDTLVNKHVRVQGQASEFPPGGAVIPHAWGPKEFTLNLKPGETAKLNPGWPVDASTSAWEFTATVQAVDFIDPNPGNNSDTERVDAQSVPGGPPPIPAGAPPGPAPLQPPAPSGADIQPTDLFPDNQPQGQMWARITNNGPDTLVNKHATVRGQASAFPPGSGNVAIPYLYVAKDVTLNLKPGETATFNLGWPVNNAANRWEFSVTAKATDFVDPNPGNDMYSESLAAVGGPPSGPPGPPGPGPAQPAPGGKTVDLAVTDLYPPQPQGNVWLRFTNNGPATLNNVDVEFKCGASGTPIGGSSPNWSHIEAPWTIKLSSKPGETKNIETKMIVDVTQSTYEAFCAVRVLGGYTDPNVSNDKYSEHIAAVGGPPGPGGPGPGGKTVDLAITDLYPPQPHGTTWLRVTNNGPAVLNDVDVQFQCGHDATPSGMTTPQWSHREDPWTVKLTSKPGETKNIETKMIVDVTQNSYHSWCTVHVLGGYTDPNPSNDTYSEDFAAGERSIQPGLGPGPFIPGGGAVTTSTVPGGGPPGSGGKFTADVTVEDIFARSMPAGKLAVRIANLGPDGLVDVPLAVKCVVKPHPYDPKLEAVAQTLSIQPHLTLQAYQNDAYDAGYDIDTTHNWYEVSCTVDPGNWDPKPGNNTHSVKIPPPP